MRYTIASRIAQLVCMSFIGWCLFSTPVVSGNAPNIPESIKADENQYQKAVKRANAEYDLKLAAAREQFVNRLKVQIANLTRKGDLDGALSLRDRVKLIEAEATSQPVSGHLQPKWGIRPSPAHQPMTGTVIACANNNYVMCINGERVLQGEKDPKQASVKIAIGDVITVRAFNNWDPYGFICLFIFKDRKKEIISSAEWKCYTPHNSLKWYSLAEIPSDLSDAQLGRTEVVVPQMEKIVMGDEQSIWGSKPGGECYLTLTVTEEVLQDLKIAVPTMQNGK